LRSFFILYLSILVASGALFSPLLAKGQVSQDEPQLIVLFDLDWTLVNPTTEKMALADSRGILRIGGKIYRISDYSIESLKALHETPGVVVGFYSGGGAKRNNSLISEIYKMLNSATAPFKYKPYIILSFEDMEPVAGARPDQKFHERFKKNIQKFLDLKKTLLGDDVLNFTPPGQEKNLIYAGLTYNDRVRFEFKSLEDPNEAAYSAPNFKKWRSERLKIPRLTGIFLESLSRSQKEKIRVVEASQELLTLEAKNQFDPVQRAFKENSFKLQNLFEPNKCSAKFR
jgi:hypothetical protein